MQVARARLAGRLRRANAALEIMADGAERYLASMDGGGSGFDLRRLRLCPPKSGYGF